MEKMQFCAIMLLSLLTLTLACLPTPKKDGAGVLSRSRWLMAGGSSLLVIQFLLQYTLRLRELGVTQAVMVNLLLFIPGSWLYDLSVLYLQRQGRLHRHEWLAGVVVCVFAVVLLVGVILTDDHSVLSASPAKLYTEVAAALSYALMQAYYAWLHIRELRRIHQMLDNYYDREMGSILEWMERSIWLLGSMALVVPLVIFGSGRVVAVFALFLFVGIYYLVISFVCYVVSNASTKVQAAEDMRDEGAGLRVEGLVMRDADHKRVSHAVEQWLAAGGHLHSGITIQTAAHEMNVPRYQLSAWLKTTEQELFNPWLTHLRIEEAKRVMLAHPEWSNDSIAEHCGFSSRNYFHTVFRQQTGVTPATFVRNAKS